MKFSFTSQTCTTKIQSERLLALGLKKETADCILVENPFQANEYIMFPLADDGSNLGNAIPAWSLHRLIEMIPKRIKYKSDYYHFDIFSEINVYMADYVDPDDNYYNLLGNRHHNIFEGIINLIEWLIKEGYFNKEYLKV